MKQKYNYWHRVDNKYALGVDISNQLLGIIEHNNQTSDKLIFSLSFEKYYESKDNAKTYLFIELCHLGIEHLIADKVLRNFMGHFKIGKQYTFEWYD